MLELRATKHLHKRAGQRSFGSQNLGGNLSKSHALIKQNILFFLI
jgi:hypothetical protein